MRLSLISGSAALLCVAFSAMPTHAATNLLANPSFEQPVTYDGAPFVGSWEAFSGGDNAGVAGSGNAAINPRTGQQHLSLSILGGPNDYAGAFQDVPVSAGNVVTFSGYNMTPSSPFDVVVEYRFEWRNSVSNTEVSRNQLNTVPTSTYGLFSITATAPAGADTARVVYDIESFGLPVGSTANGTVYADDFSVTIAPEPTTLAALGAAGLFLRRRR